VLTGSHSSPCDVKDTMLKRKREEEEEEAHSDRDKLREDSALRIRKSRLAARIDQGNVLLHRALKLARGFERQKLGRRQKAAGENAQKLHRLKEEVIFLKQLELARAAENHLLKQLFRTKRIREAPAFVSLYGNDVDGKVSGPKSGAEANVVGRLVNSNPVREVIPGIMSGIYGCLGLDEASSGTNDRREKIVSSIVKASAEGNLDRGEGDRRTGPGHLKLFRVDKDHRTDTSSNSSGDDFVTKAEKLAEAASDPQESEEDDEMAQFNGRLASSSGSDGSGFEQDETSRTRSLNMNGKSQPTGSSSSTPSPSPGPSSISPSPQPPQRSATAIPTPKPRSTKPPSNTTFLPSLTLGGYFSGSESTSDADPDAPFRHQTHTFSTAPTLPQPRKNRRGQRARQQIAEKKYGSGAKHLQKQQQQQQQQRPPSKQGRDAGWDPRMGATAGAGTAMGKRKGKGKGKGKGWQVGGGRGLKATGANVEPVTRGKSKEKAKSTVDGPVHPSWEAARKRKQQQTQSVTGMFRGKKISFD
jgi:BUD22